MLVLNMTGRFYDWGDFGGLLPEETIRSKLLYRLANGMCPSIGGHFHLRGDLENAVLDRIEKIYTNLQTCEEWFAGAKSITDIVVVYLKFIQHLRNDTELRSAVRMLCEMKQQFDVVTMTSGWSMYEVLIFPDSILFTDEITERVKQHIAAGRQFIAIGISGLNIDQTAFALDQDWGIHYIGKSRFDPVYFTV